jgi:hypothetical protein
VTWDQICDAGAELCRHYGPVLLIPLKLETQEPASDPEGAETAQFWKEREAEFRKHDAPENELVADWFSLDDSWSFRTSLARSPAPGLEQVFKSLAREAAKGLAYAGDDESWIVWLNALRRAIDRSTGRRIYSAISSTGSLQIRERESDQMFKSRDAVPRGGVWKFVASGSPDQPVTGAESLMYWETTTEMIEHLFTSSANFCLELRSLIRNDRTTNENKGLGKAYKTVMGANIDRLRKECGWSFDDLAEVTRIDKKRILAHVNKGSGAHPSTLEAYAEAFTEKLGRPVTVAELEESPQ